MSLNSSQQMLKQGLNIQQIDTNSSAYIQQQPLSPTHSNQGPQNATIYHKFKEMKQTSFKGVPQLVGLSHVDYLLDERLTFFNGELAIRDVTKNYLSQLYEEGEKLFENPLVKVQEQYSKLEVVINLPFEMLIEQVELVMQNSDMFQKYLKLLKIEKNEDEEQGMLLLKSGVQDNSKKAVELNTCGVTQQLKLCFLFKKKERLVLSQELLSQQDKNVTQYQQSQKVSDKIKNEIIPLLNNNDDDIDELDDEVAMISNKLSGQEISPNDIRIDMKPDRQSSKEKMQSKQSKKFENQKNNDEDLENTRDFNSLPRNYNSSQPQKDKPYSDQITSENWFIKLICKAIKSIRVTGFNFNQIPAITNMTQFMNNVFYLKKEHYHKDATEIKYLVGVLMVTNKRNVQATEMLRQIQSEYLKEIEELQKWVHSFTNESQRSHKPQRDQYEIQYKKLEINRYMLKCALLELLIAESFNQPTQVNEKLLSMQRMTHFANGKVMPQLIFSPQLQIHDDSYTTMIKILPSMLKFLLMCLTHKREIVKISALKLLEFILETQGCSLDLSMVFILKAMLKTYPGLKFQRKNHYRQDSFCPSQLSSSGSEYFTSPRDQKENQTSKQVSKAKYLTNQVKPESMQIVPNEFLSIKEPTSGYTQALKNVYNHVLETYISVLSSISSHILHQLFYEVIVPTLNQNCEKSEPSYPEYCEIKTFSIKIAEKIITICQGDLILTKFTLEQFIQSVVAKQGANESHIQHMKNLWLNIRQKVFTNYSQKGLKTLIEWIVEKMSMMAQNGQIEGSSKSAQSDIAKLEITDEDQIILSQLLDIISLIAIGRKKSDEEANQLIKIKQEYCIELYLVINPLLFWLDFSVEREERLPLFKQVYQTIKDVLDNLPPKKVDLDVLQIMIPILQRTTEYLKNNSPTLSMLKFLDIVLKDIKSGNYCNTHADLQYFFLDMLNNLAPYIQFCLYEEVFSVFDKLLSMCQDVINETVLTKCIVALVDKCTMKNKSQKNSQAQFMKSLLEVKVRNHSSRKEKRQQSNNNNFETDDNNELDEEELSIHSKNNFFEILCDFCFFNNEDYDPKKQSHYLKEFRQPIDVHDIYIDKLQFFIDALSLMNEIHVTLFTSLVAHPKFKSTLLGLLNKGEIPIRLKCHEILELLTNYFTQFCTSKTVYEVQVHASAAGGGKKPQTEQVDVEFINHERLYIAQIVVQCVRTSLDQKNDSYLQFNSLILLDFLFQQLLPVPTYQNEQLKVRASQGKSNQNQSSQGNPKQEQIIDLETLEINESTPEFEVTEQKYINMRLNLVFKLWPYIKDALNSAWSNIRSICYGLICSMLKIDLRDYQPSSGQSTYIQTTFYSKLKQNVLPMLLGLLSSKESESKAGGLNILGSFCGLSYDFTQVKISKNLEFFKKNSNFISLGIWQLVFDLQDDWDITIKEASVVLIQLCAPREAVKYFDKVKREKEQMRLQSLLNKFGMTPGSGGNRSQTSSKNQFYNSNEEENVTFTQNQYLETKKMNLMSFLSGTDDMSLMFQMDQQQPGMQNDIFEMTNTNLQNMIAQNRTRKQISGSNTDEEFKDELKKNEQDLDNFPELIELENGILSDQQSQFQFFVDGYSDSQIQEIISIFRNDFKPPKNLWIEKNQSAAFNSPDYYLDIYSQAIEQFNAQQKQLMQQQQESLNNQVNSSPRNANGVVKLDQPVGSMHDALEDDLVQRYEKQKKEKESKEKPKQGSLEESNFLSLNDSRAKSLESSKSDDEKSGSGSSLESQGNIDAEPYKFFEKEGSPNSRVIENKPELQNTQLKIIDESDQQKKFKNAEIKTETHKLFEDIKFDDITIGKDDFKHAKPKDATTHDEILEKYEKKINKTKQLLQEEEIKTTQRTENKEISSHTETVPNSEVKNQSHQQVIESNSKSTPDFKSKKEQPLKLNESNFMNVTNLSYREMSAKNSKKQAQLYLQELNKGFINTIDNKKLIKQINSVFNDNSFIQNVASGAQTAKVKSKLNKSYENLLAANKQSARLNQGDITMSGQGNKPKKNQSSSPKRGNSSGKKSLNKSGIQSKRKHEAKSNQNKALYNMRDLNYFIKTIEKDINEKYSKLNIKDFNSMPTTPTSILKKVEEQVKAMADKKPHFSNTAPNMAQILNQINQETKQGGTPLNIQNVNAKIIGTSISSNVTPSNISSGASNAQNVQSHQTLSDTGNYAKQSFSKTQRLDLKDANKQIFQYQSREVSHRDVSSDKKEQLSPISEEKYKYANLLKANKIKGTSKRSRGSHDKYQSASQEGVSINSQKLNKSLNMISSGNSYLKKEHISKVLNTNISPQQKKGKQPTLNLKAVSKAQTLYQTPATQFDPRQNSGSGTAFFDFNSITGDQSHKRQHQATTKTPNKNQYKYAPLNYSEIIEISPSSGEKEHRIKPKQLF